MVGFCVFVIVLLFVVGSVGFVFLVWVVILCLGGFVCLVLCGLFVFGCC